MNNPFSLLFVVAFIILFSCEKKQETLFVERTAIKTGITFKNTLKETDGFNVLNYSYFYNGGGVAVGDLNNDDLPDIYLVGNLVASHLYLNRGNWTFENIASKAGVTAEGLWNTGVTMADVNNDGWLDIYVCRSAAANPNARRNLLFINNGDLTFSEQAAKYGIDDPAYSTQAAFFDYDRDGDLDLFLLNHSVPQYSNFQTSIGRFKNRSNPFYGDKLYRNEGGVFTDVSKEAGIINNVLGFGLGLAIADLNNDYWPDVYVSNDFNEEDYLYINQQDGTFSENLAQKIDHTSLFSMGSDAADINNDGATDLLTLDMLPDNNYRDKMTSGADNFDKYQLLRNQGFYPQNMRNMLQLNEGDGTFKEIGQISGISNTDWSWSALFADYDLDGWQDVFITNGYLRDYTNMDFLAYTVDQKMKENKTGEQTSINDLLSKMPEIQVNNQAFQNLDGTHFEEVSQSWGFSKPLLSNGAAYADLDNDGDLDLVVNNVNELASVYQNTAIEKERGNYLKVKPERSAQGLTVELFAQELQMKRELFVSRGYQSAVEPVLYFGIPKEINRIDSLLAYWPDGSVSSYQHIDVNTTFKVQKSNERPINSSMASNPTIFRQVELLDFKHQEDNFNDFKIQGLLPWFYSRQGPPITIADFNGDGKDEIVLGGAKDQPTTYLKEQKQQLFFINHPSFEANKIYEDVDIASGDFDGDGDPDLVIASGGNLPNASNLANSYPIRLYFNNGDGTFSTSVQPISDLCHASCIAVGDVDNDGDQDVFVGGTYKPGNYPHSEENFLFINDGKGKFVKSSALPFDNAIINDAIIVDIDRDKTNELIFAGEWGNLQIWSLNSERWTKEVEAPEKGWWNEIHCVDLDEDPELEIIVGNFGLNSQFKASAT